MLQILKVLNKVHSMSPLMRERQFTHFYCFVAFCYINISRFIHFTVSRPVCVPSSFSHYNNSASDHGHFSCCPYAGFLEDVYFGEGGCQIMEYFHVFQILPNCLPKWLVGPVFTPKGVCDCNYSVSSQTRWVPVTIIAGHMSWITFQSVSAKSQLD